MILYDEIAQWGKDRKITINGKVNTQFVKLVEELGEIIMASKEEVKDGVGDSVVVLIMINELLGYHKRDFFPVPLPDLMYAPVLKVVGALANKISRDKPCHHEINTLLYTLTILSDAENLTFNECIEYAYNEIKDRKGYLNEEGSFIKEES